MMHAFPSVSYEVIGMGGRTESALTANSGI